MSNHYLKKLRYLPSLAFLKTIYPIYKGKGTHYEDWHDYDTVLLKFKHLHQNYLDKYGDESKQKNKHSIFKFVIKT